MSTATARTLHLPRIVAIGLIVVGLGVTACGRKGPLEVPPNAKPEDIRSPKAKPLPPEEGKRPDRPFILDGLLM